LPLGIEESDQGCQPTNPTCNLTQLLADNTINTIEPQLINPQNGNFRPIEGGTVFGTTTYTIPDFLWDDAPTQPAVPQGNLSNQIALDRDKNQRSSSTPPGAYTGETTPPTSFTLTLRKGGSGKGSVVSTPEGIDCDGNCQLASFSYNPDANVILFATADMGSIFTGWSGDCTGTESCTVTMNRNRTATATFQILVLDGPDLTGEWGYLPQTCKNTRSGQKCTLKGTLTIRNSGNRDSIPTDVNFYLSDDGVTYQEGDWLKRISLGKIKRGRSKSLKFSYSFPVPQSAKGRYIIAVLDRDDLVEEIDKTNNIVVFGPIA
jgi:uncharacterized repeat protein (TIGR02543 family)